MIKTTITMQVNAKELSRIVQMYPKRAKAIVDKFAIDVQADEKKNTHNYGGSHRDTGAMVNGWTVKLSSGGGDGRNIPSPDQDIQAVVGNEVAIYPELWENGHRNFAPEPSLGDAIESNRKPFENAWKGLFV